LINVAICEDRQEAATIIVQHLSRYEKERGVSLTYTVFENGLFFLENLKKQFDVVFMDIDMPIMNGLEAAKRLREVDPYMPLVFITDLKQFAIKGYEVEAVDFLVKPLTYSSFCTMMDRIQKRLLSNGNESLLLQTVDGTVKVSLKNVKYVEVLSHYVYYHTIDGTFKFWGSLIEEEKRLPKDRFAKAGSAHLVNLAYVTKVKGNDIYLGNEIIPLSRSKKTTFLEELLEYMNKI